MRVVDDTLKKRSLKKFKVWQTNLLPFSLPSKPLLPWPSPHRKVLNNSRVLSSVLSSENKNEIMEVNVQTQGFYLVDYAMERWKCIKILNKWKSKTRKTFLKNIFDQSCLVQRWWNRHKLLMHFFKTWNNIILNINLINFSIH